MSCCVVKKMLIVLSGRTFYFGRDDFKKKKSVFDLSVSHQQHNRRAHTGRLGKGQIQTLERKEDKAATSGSAEHPQCPSQGTEPSQGSFLKLHPWRY